MANDFSITGLNAVNRAFENADRRVKTGMEQIIKEYSVKAQRKIRRQLTINKSVRTGRLRRSISIERVTRYESVVGTNVFYGKYVEFGTRRFKAKPYIRPIGTQLVDEFNKSVNDLLGGVE